MLKGTLRAHCAMLGLAILSLGESGIDVSGFAATCLEISHLVDFWSCSSSTFHKNFYVSSEEVLISDNLICKLHMFTLIKIKFGKIIISLHLHCTTKPLKILFSKYFLHQMLSFDINDYEAACNSLYIVVCFHIFI